MNPLERTCEVVFFKGGLFDSKIKLDSRKLNNIGLTKESLREFIESVFLFNRPELRYYITKDKLIRHDGRRWKLVQRIDYDLNNL